MSIVRVLTLPIRALTRVAGAAQTHAFGVALTFSIVLHIITIGSNFAAEEPRKKVRDRGLEVILVNSHSLNKPDPKTVQALAQTNLDGGGNTDRDRRAKTFLKPDQNAQNGDQLEQMRKRVETPEAALQRELIAKNSKLKTRDQDKEAFDFTSAKPADGADMLESARAMARLEAEIAKDLDEYNRRPRRNFIGTRTQEYRFAQYIEDWRQKVERWGTLNYPEAARGKLSGTLTLTIILNRNGEIVEINIDKPSPHKVLDDAAIRIARMAAPYAPFPPAISRDTDQLAITRSWTFTRGNSLETR
ncbi:MAG: energy transducer TonB [Zoogloeaceae bacterium]|jgi:protein TonB|nr:energy transducer TonB [Zoogloeaceae bacterium]